MSEHLEWRVVYHIFGGHDPVYEWTYARTRQDAEHDLAECQRRRVYATCWIETRTVSDWSRVDGKALSKRREGLCVNGRDHAWEDMEGEYAPCNCGIRS